MPMPYERTRAQVEAGFFLRDLVDPEVTHGVPGAVREHAAYLLLNYPEFPDSEIAHKALVARFGTMPPLRRVGQD